MAQSKLPWVADDNEGFGQWGIWSGSAPSGHGNGTKIAIVIGDSAEAEANAKLIAAAPELLELARTLIHFQNQGGSMPVHLQNLCVEARSAIAKATA